MPLDLVWHDERPEYVARKAGAAYFIDAEGYRFTLSKHYLEHVAHIRPPIVVMIQSRKPEWAFPFIIDSHPSSEPDGRWDVTVDMSTLVDGQKPDITVSPSIKCFNGYHGFLQHGTLTDDIGD